ncbi:cell division protein ZipA [Halomonas sp. V046]|uniref:cell division protein ZipA n=1 Tax=Halomonas sp. V046 TaxID=3459611 RepID=UPI004044D303
MELREWLIILGLALVTLIVIDGVRRLQRQRRTPRLDEVEGDVFGTTQNLSEQDSQDPEQEAREAEMNWELPNGGARVLKRADFSSVQPKPKLERQEHPGPSRVLHEFRASHAKATTEASASVAGTSVSDAPRAADHASAGMDGARPEAAATAPSEPRVAAEPHRGDAQVASGSDSDHAGQGAAADVAPAADQDRHSVREGTESPELERTESPQREQTESPQLERTESPQREQTESPQLERTESPQREQTESPQLERTESPELERTESPQDAERRREPVISARRDEEVAVARTKGEASEPLAADPDDHDDFDEDQYRLVDFEGMGDSLKSSSRRVGSSMQRFGASLQKNLAERREQKRLERERREALKAEKAAEAARQAEARAEHQARREAELEAAKEAERLRLAELREQQERDAVGDGHADAGDGNDEAAEFAPAQEDNVRTHPVLEKALRHDVNAEKARDSLSGAEEIIVISVMSRDEGGFPGTTLLELMMACGLRYSREMGIFHRFETEDADSALQFSMVNVLKPGTFPIEAMDDFTTPGITLLMPLPSADDTSAAFEAMVETAMVIVRHMGGELKDENRSVMTAQTVEFARQRVQEFERRHRLHRYQVN